MPFSIHKSVNPKQQKYIFIGVGVIVFIIFIVLVSGSGVGNSVSPLLAQLHSQCLYTSGSLEKCKSQIESLINFKNKRRALVPSNCKLVEVGTKYGGWYTCLDVLDADSIVYDIGVGNDRSWSEGLIKKRGVKVWGFDPTPITTEYIDKVGNMNGRWTLIPVGIDAFDGTMTFYPPDHGGASHTAIEGTSGHDKLDPIKCWFLRLDTVMASLGHTWIDVLKIDIEGSEYAVLDLLFQKPVIPATQIQIEFHDRFMPNPVEARERIQYFVQKFVQRGFQYKHVSSDDEYTFYRTKSVEF